MMSNYIGNIYSNGVSEWKVVEQAQTKITKIHVVVENKDGARHSGWLEGDKKNILRINWGGWQPFIYHLVKESGEVE